MIEFSIEEKLSEHINQNDVLIILFYAKWCMPCKSISQTLLNLAGNYSKKVQIVALNVDEFSAIALAENIRTVPTLHYYKSGSIYLKESGFRTQSQLVKNIEALISIECIDEK